VITHAEQYLAEAKSPPPHRPIKGISNSTLL
jgi:hypothetical protein